MGTMIMTTSSETSETSEKSETFETSGQFLTILKITHTGSQTYSESPQPHTGINTFLVISALSYVIYHMQKKHLQSLTQSRDRTWHSDLKPAQIKNADHNLGQLRAKRVCARVK